MTLAFAAAPQSSVLPGWLDLGPNPAQAVVEIVLLAVGIYALLRFLRSTRGVGVLRGLVVFLLLALVAFSALKMTLGVPVLEEILRRITPALVLILAILFQPELRQGISRFGQTGIFRILSANRQTTREAVVNKVATAAARLARERTGALITFERGVSLDPYMENAVRLDAPVSAILLETIFFPGGPLHDGAVVIREDRVAAAAALLPLTQNPDVQRRMGTRHRAALGITEETDAVSLVVSEETGQISLCAGGRLYQRIPLDQIEERLAALLAAEQRRSGASSAVEGPASAEAKPAPEEGGENALLATRYLPAGEEEAEA